MQQMIEFRLEGHDAAGKAEYQDEGARDQGEIEMEVEQQFAHLVTSYRPGR
jgi:hypothetical protein